MTVGELVLKLGEYDPGLPVMIQGYEGGLADLTSERIKEIHDVALNYNPGDGWIYGVHEPGEGDVSALTLWRLDGDVPR